MKIFSPDLYGSAVADLLRASPINELGPGTPQEGLQPQLQIMTPDRIFEGKSISDPQMAAACLSGLWLRLDFLDSSHSLSQMVKTPEGNYWHAIMHRREPDFSNSKHWFSQVGDHPVFPDLREGAAELVEAEGASEKAQFLKEQDTWDATAFVDLCESCLNGKSTDIILARRIQGHEWDLLFDYCYHKARGK